MRAETQLGFLGKARGGVPCALALLFLASCVPAPQTLSAAADLRFRDGERHSFPQCSSVSGDPFAMTFYKPAIDIGNGMAAVVSEGFAEADSGRYATVVDCETGLGLRFKEPLMGADEASGEDQTLSDDPSFKSPLEKLLLSLSSSGNNRSIRSISAHVTSEGFSAKPWLSWEPDSVEWRPNEEEACACNLYYPAIERRWFDNRKIGPDYPEALGSNPNTLSELEARMIALRAKE